MSNDWNGSVYQKGPKLYIRVRMFGKWKSIATPYGPGQEAEAEEFLRDTRRKILAAEAAGAKDGPLTVAEYAEEWLRRRRARGDKWDVENDAGRLRKHILTKIGSKRIGDVLPADVRAVIDAASAAGRAYRTVRNIYSTVRMLFNEAVVDGLLATRDNPCVLTRAHLPPNRDKNPRWRAKAVFERMEVGSFLYDQKVPDDRRVYYAMLYFTGMRLGEVSGLRIEDYEPDVAPLSRLLVSRSYNRDWTKTGVERVVPVHPELKRILDAWIASGWEAFVGRPPRATDILIPDPVRPSAVEHLQRREEAWIAVRARRHRPEQEVRSDVVSPRLEVARAQASSAARLPQVDDLARPFRRREEGHPRTYLAPGRKGRARALHDVRVAGALRGTREAEGAARCRDVRT
jgi:integrase